MRTATPTALLLALLSLAGCDSNDATLPPSTSSASSVSSANVEAQLRDAFANAEPGAVIEIPPGTHAMTRSLVLNREGITLRGAGEKASILNFSGQIAGAEGLLLSGDNLTLEGFAVEDTRGDAIKVTDSRNVVIRHVRAEWTNGPHTENGAYGIYPVQTENLLVEHSVAIGASDAGIYVGQSRNIVVRDNVVRYNVAGIEIENSVDADVYDNLAEHNTGGILVFNMPDIPLRGERTRVFDNNVNTNNTANFAAPGTAVSGVPAGSGIMINSNDLVEIFDNSIGDHNTANIVISSYFSANYAGQREPAPEFDPYPETLYIYDNRFGPSGGAPDIKQLDALRVALYGADGTLPDLIWDGMINPERAVDGRLPAAQRICVNNGEAVLLDVDMANGNANPSADMSRHRCEHPKLPAVELESALS